MHPVYQQSTSPTYQAILKITPWPTSVVRGNSSQFIILIRIIYFIFKPELSNWWPMGSCGPWGVKLWPLGSYSVPFVTSAATAAEGSGLPHASSDCCFLLCPREKGSAMLRGECNVDARLCGWGRKGGRKKILAHPRGLWLALVWPVWCAALASAGHGGVWPLAAWKLDSTVFKQLFMA